MLDMLKIKRAECVDDIAVCEEELREARIKLKLLDEIISDAEEMANEESTEETAADVNNGSVAMFN